MRLLWWVPVVSFSAFIFWISSREPPTDLPQRIPHFDKVLHFGAYGVWAILFCMPLARTRPGLSRARFTVIVGIAGTLYGLSDEIHQAFVPSRQADIADLLADAAGAFCGGLGFDLLLRRFFAPRAPRKSRGETE